MKSDVGLLDLPVGQRVRRVARNGLAFSLYGILLGIAAAIGGRFQFIRGSAADIWMLAALYPVGMELTGIVGALFGSWWKNRWTAAVAVGVSTVPLFALISVSAAHSGPTAPYRIEWPIVALCCGVSAMLTPMYYNYCVRRMTAIHERMRNRRARAA